MEFGLGDSGFRVLGQEVSCFLMGRTTATRCSVGACQGFESNCRGMCNKTKLAPRSPGACLKVASQEGSIIPHRASKLVQVLFGGSWVSITPAINLPISCLEDLGRSISTVMIGVISTHEPPKP